MASLWVASAPPGGRLSASHLIPSSDVEAVLAEVFATGSGYLEIGPDDDSAQALSLGAADGLSVVHIQDPGGEEMSLLVGDGSVAATTSIEVQIIDERARFTGAYISRLERALTLVRRFAEGEDPQALGEWHEL